ncbi:MAG: hypothetical protein FJ398_07710 [Verrucomicrobia bacterium]|nr:hypothetical protein [Verrucomicrobiota bacterium]
MRQAAATALKEIGIPGQDAAPPLTDLLTNRDPRVRWYASELVTNVQPPLTREFILGLAGALRMEDGRNRPNILAALKGCQPAAHTAWPDLVAQLQHTNAAVRASAAEALGVCAPATASVTEALEQALCDVQPQVRLEAAFALCQIDPSQEPRCTPYLLDRLQDPKVFWRRKAARYLAEMRLTCPAAIPTLKFVLKDLDPETRLLAARAIVQTDPDQADSVIPVLRDALLDRGPQRRTLAAAQILGDLGPRARGAVPALAEAIDDAYAPSASAAADALEKIEPGLLLKLKNDPAAKRNLVLPELIRALAGSLELLGFALQSLKRFGVNARDAVPHMIAALEHPDLKDSRYDWVWLRALDAFGAIGPSASPAVPLLVQALRHKTVAIRSSAAAALRRIGLASTEVISTLVKCLSGPFHKYAHVRGKGFFGQTRRERRAYPEVDL